MLCPACGTPASPGVNFCARCGSPIPASQTPPPPVAAHYGIPYAPVLRVQRNLQAMAILWYVFAAYRAFAGLFGVLILNLFSSSNTHRWMGGPLMNGFGDGSPRWIAGAMVPVIAGATIATVALSVAVGWGLTNRRPWARTVAIIAAVLALIKFPMGTALGIYTLWVLAPTESGVEWDGIVERT